MSTQRLAQTARLEPTAAQRQRLAQAVGGKRWVGNWARARKQAPYQAPGATLSTALRSNALPLLKRQPDTRWRASVNAAMRHQVRRDRDTADANVFAKRARCPTGKKRHRARHACRLPAHTKLRAGAVACPTLGGIPRRLARPIPGTSKSAPYRSDACGEWFVSRASQTDEELPAPGDPQTRRGIAVGRTTDATRADGTAVAHPRFRKRGQRTLRRAQRKLRRQGKGRANRLRAKQRVARRHRRIARPRTDFPHQRSTALVKRYDLIALEDLNLQGLVSTTLAHSFSDAACGAFFRQLRDKALWAGQHSIAIDRCSPSSTTWSACQVVNQTRTLTDRQWTCSACGVRQLRDWNAAHTSRQEGWRNFAVGHTKKANAGGAHVSLAAASGAW